MATDFNNLTSKNIKAMSVDEKRYIYNHITLEEMKNFIVSEHEEDKAWFKGVLFENKKPKKAVIKVDVNGNPIPYYVKKKDGTFKTDKNGNKIQRFKTIMVYDANSKDERKPNILKAKREFCLRYFPELVPIKSKKIINSVLEEIDNW